MSRLSSNFTLPVKCAFSLNNYYLTQTILLSGISKDFNSAIVESEINEFENRLNSSETKYERLILLTKQIMVFYEHNKFKTVDNFEKAALNLQELG